MRVQSRTDHFQHVRSSRLDRSPEDIVLVNDLSLNHCVFWANVCTHTDMHTHIHLKWVNKQIKDIIKTDIYSGGLINTI